MVVAYALLGLLLAVEVFAIGRRRAGAERRDAGTFWLLHALIGGGFTAAFWTTGARGIAAGPVASGAGIALAVLGAGVRLWALRVLGQWFTRDVHVSADQPVIDVGPYRLVRHPSYTGLLLIIAGIGVALGNVLAAALVLAPTLTALVIRVRVEEAALVDALGAPYRQYMGRTKRFLPYII